MKRGTGQYFQHILGSEPLGQTERQPKQGQLHRRMNSFVWLLDTRYLIEIERVDFLYRCSFFIFHHHLTGCSGAAGFLPSPGAARLYDFELFFWVPSAPGYQFVAKPLLFDFFGQFDSSANPVFEKQIPYIYASVSNLLVTITLGLFVKPQ